jgi:hypothetical protein
MSPAHPVRRAARGLGLTRPQLAELAIADPPERWQALGFTVGGDATLTVGPITITLGAPGEGITAWTIRGIAAGITDLDGLPTTATTAPARVPATHPNGAVGIDHVVITTPDFDRTARSLARAELELRRIQPTAAGVRQGFRRLGPAILELVEVPQAASASARFWGLVVTVGDLAALAQRLGERLGAIHPAVQPGRHIATLDRAAAMSTMIAFMGPEPDGVARGSAPEPEGVARGSAPEPERLNRAPTPSTPMPPNPS